MDGRDGAEGDVEATAVREEEGEGVVEKEGQEGVGS